jgi:hypothetical protein
MAHVGKPDVTGRSSGKLAGRERKIFGPPEGQPWVWQTAELLGSPAWKAMGINARRLVEFLQIEHCAHAARENGR